MSEIEKMYENCNIAPQKEGYCGWDCDCPYPDIINNGCGDERPYWEYEDEAKYPPFTAEKQIELIKWLATKFSFFAIEYNFQEWSSSNGLISGFYKKSLEESIADYINSLWQDLTEEEKQQVRGILE